MTARTEDRKRHPLTYVFSGVLGILLLALQASTSAPPSSPAAVDPGTIAYVRRPTRDIHLISADGIGDRVLWTAPRPLALRAAHDLAWRPADVNDSTSSLWIAGRDGSGLPKLADDAGRPAWGPPALAQPKTKSL